MTKSLFHILLLLATMPFAWSAPEKQVLSFKGIESQLDQLLGPYIYRSGPGIAVFVKKGSRFVYRRFHGLAQIQDPQRKIHWSSNFRLASVSKQFTAMAIALLEREGKVHLEDKIFRYIPELPEYANDVRVRHLLYHTSGLPTYFSVCQDEKDYTNLDAILELNKKAGLLFSPGTQYKYSNSGYMALALLVERLTQKTFLNYLKENIFSPLGMLHSTVYEPHHPFISNRVFGYDILSPKRFEENDRHSCMGIYGDGSVYSSIHDLELWYEHLERLEVTQPDFIKKIYRRGSLDDGSPVDYGYGWKTTGEEDKKIIWHSGRWIGFTHFSGYVPKGQTRVLILSNNGKGKIKDLSIEILSLLESEIQLTLEELRISDETN